VRASLGSLQGAVDARMARWSEANFGPRLMDHDPTLWPTEHRDEVSDRLGWTNLPTAMRSVADGLAAFADEVRLEGIRHAVVLGMGGSSLAPEVYQAVFGNAEGYPELTVLDSTHPAAVGAVEENIDLDSTLFVVSSKSGSTLETLSFFRYFWSKYSGDAGRHFVAVSDPGSSLVALAGERSFRRVFEAPPDVGGRYSALTVFGLVPAALIGIDVAALLESARPMEKRAASNGEPVHLGAIMGEAALAGRDKATFLVSPKLAGFPLWLEQLIAESTGKEGKGIVPIVDEVAGDPDVYGEDRIFVYLALDGDDDEQQSMAVAALEGAGHPVVRLVIEDIHEVFGEFHGFETSVAAAGLALGINPFDQPDVELAKELARAAMGREGSELDAPPISSDSEAVEGALVAFLSRIRPGDYVALQAFIAPSPPTTESLQRLRHKVRDHHRVATTVGYGPRFLHSTGQLHKGGPSSGAFIQLVDDAGVDIAVPETDFTFGQVLAAQAAGDAAALAQRGRRILRLNLGPNPDDGLEQLVGSLG